MDAALKSIQEAYVGMQVQIDETVSDHAITLMQTGNYDPEVRGSATKFKADLKKTGATTSDMTAQIAWTKHKSWHPKPEIKKDTTKPKFNEHDPSTWHAGYSHRGNPMFLD
jgi:hypothetical protein